MYRRRSIRHVAPCAAGTSPARARLRALVDDTAWATVRIVARDASTGGGRSSRSVRSVGAPRLGAQARRCERRVA
eukprot:7161643-Alexandrium_andersonii.AAC.1